MKNNAVSGFPLTACVFLVTVLLCVTGTTYAKRGCSAFGHSCFGGHGKRFDSQLRDLKLQEKEAAMSDSVQETGALRLGSLFVVPQQVTLPPQSRRQASLRFDPYTLSSIVRQWLMAHHRLGQPEMEFDKK